MTLVRYSPPRVIGVTIGLSAAGAAFGGFAGAASLAIGLGRAFGGLTIGTVIGGVLGWLTLGPLDPLVLPIAAGALGFLAAAICLRLTHAFRGTSHDGTGAA